MEICVHYPQWLLLYMNKLSWNDCIFESWNFPEYDSKNVLKFWKSFRKTPTLDISFVNFRSKIWTNDLWDHSSSRPLTDIKRILVVERFQFIFSTHPEPYNQKYTFSKLQLFPYTHRKIHQNFITICMYSFLK